MVNLFLNFGKLIYKIIYTTKIKIMFDIFKIKYCFNYEEFFLNYTIITKIEIKLGVFLYCNVNISS